MTITLPALRASMTEVRVALVEPADGLARGLNRFPVSDLPRLVARLLGLPSLDGGRLGRASLFDCLPFRFALRLHGPSLRLAPFQQLPLFALLALLQLPSFPFFPCLDLGEPRNFFGAPSFSLLALPSSS